MDIAQLIIDHQSAVGSLMTVIVMLGTTYLARYHIAPNNKWLIAIRILFGAVYDQIHPEQFKALAAQAKATNKQRKANMKKVVLNSLVALFAFFALSCTNGGTLQQKLNTVVVFEQQTQGYEQQLVLAGQAAIAGMPAEKQEEARAKLMATADAVTKTYAAKDKALQDAIAQDSAGKLDLGQLTADVVQATEALIELLKVFGVAESKLAEARANIQASHASVKAVLAK